jgi:hypothetical protein
MKGHFHTGPVDLAVTAVGVLVIIHVMRIVAAQLAERPWGAGAGKVVAAFALSD